MSFRISHIVIGILLLGVIVTGFYTFVGDMASENAYDMEYDDYSTTFDQIDIVSDEINESFTDMEERWETNIGGSFGYITLIPQALSLAKNIILLPFRVTGGLIFDIIRVMGIPIWLQGFALAIIGALLIFGILALVLRYRYV